jgi:hypothetical protein
MIFSFRNIYVKRHCK